MTPEEALVIIRAKVTLPKGAVASISTTGNGVAVGLDDLTFVMAGPALEHDEEYLLDCTNQYVKVLEREMVVQAEAKVAQAKAAALVESQKLKRKRKK